MFKDVQFEHHWSHDTHQADSPIFAKCVQALHCQWLQQLLLLVPSAHPRLWNRVQIDQSFHKSPQKEIT